MAAHVHRAEHIVAAHGTNVHDFARQAGIGATIGNDMNVFRHNNTFASHTQFERDAFGQARATG